MLSFSVSIGFIDKATGINLEWRNENISEEVKIGMGTPTETIYLN